MRIVLYYIQNYSKIQMYISKNFDFSSLKCITKSLAVTNDHTGM